MKTLRFLYTSRTAEDKPTSKPADVEADFKKYLEKTDLGQNISVELREVYQSPDLYYLHRDHLGTATFVTNSQSQATQFFLNLSFGETMIEQMDGSYDNPFKFNAKELDEDTGLYYYGARYYNPRLSIWYGVDPLAVYNPVMEDEFYGDGQHNGGVYFWGNLNPYIYTYQNPIKYIDPNGKQTEAPASRGYRPGIPIPIFKKGPYYIPFPPIDPVEKKVREGFDIAVSNDAKITLIKMSLATLAYQKLKSLFADKLKPENGYKRGKEHGIAWQEGDAKRRARETGNPQGKWGSQEDLDYAGEKVGTLAPGPEKNGKATPGDFEDFPINEGSTSTVYNPDGTQSKPDKIRIRNNGNGTFHGFPVDSKTAGSIHKKAK